VGLPGGSNAMAIASRLGLSADIVTTAREMLSPGTQKMEALLVEIARERDQATAQRQTLDVARVEAEKLRDKLAQELQELEKQKRRILAEARESVETEAAELQRQLRQASSELKKMLTKQRLEETRKALEAVREQLRSTAWKSPPLEVEGVEQVETAKELAVGDRVWLPEMQLWGTVLSTPNDRGELEIQVGNAKLRLGIEHIERKEVTAAGAATPIQPTLVRPRSIPSLELDLRGRRADEVPPELERYLNDVSLARLPQVRIIHGFGTGVVRQIVRSILSQHPLVKSFHPADAAHGGDGATAVEL
jgi:DNA mismatch repair protein MutS2